MGSASCPSGFGSGVQFAPAQFLGAPPEIQPRRESRPTLAHEVEELRAEAASQIRAIEKERHDAQRQIINHCVLVGLDEKLDGLRQMVTSWPPWKDMDEATGCEKLQEMLVTSCLRTEHLANEDPEFTENLRRDIYRKVADFLQTLKETLVCNSERGVA